VLKAISVINEYFANKKTLHVMNTDTPFNVEHHLTVIERLYFKLYSRISDSPGSEAVGGQKFSDKTLMKYLLIVFLLCGPCLVPPAMGVAGCFSRDPGFPDCFAGTHAQRLYYPVAVQGITFMLILPWLSFMIRNVQDPLYIGRETMVSFSVVLFCTVSYVVLTASTLSFFDPLRGSFFILLGMSSGYFILVWFPNVLAFVQMRRHSFAGSMEQTTESFQRLLDVRNYSCSSSESGVNWINAFICALFFNGNMFSPLNSYAMAS
jgi:hypothetical protein